MNPDITKEILEQKYIHENLNIYQISDLYGITYQRILRKIKYFNIPLKGRYKNISGFRFGKLIVESLADTGKRTIWKCKCDCGGTKLIEAGSLMLGRAKSCGHCDKSILGKNYFTKIKRGAIQRNLEFNITKDYICDLFIKQNQKCALSGVNLIIKYDGTKMTASLDRIDSKIGYIEENVQWIHKDVNKMKMDFPENKFLEWIKTIYLYNQK